MIFKLLKALRREFTDLCGALSVEELTENSELADQMRRILKKIDKELSK